MMGLSCEKEMVVYAGLTTVTGQDELA